MANLQKIPLNNASGFSGRQIPECGGQYERGAYASANAAVYDYAVGSRSITKPDGTRYLVNEGIKAAEFPMSTGQAIAFDGTQEIATNVAIDLSQDLTLIWSQEKKDSLDQQFGSSAGGVKSEFGLNALGVYLGLSNEAITLESPLVPGNLYTMAVRYNADLATANVTIINSLMTSANINVDKTALMSELLLGRVAGSSVTMTGLFGGFYVLPQLLTDQELLKHYQRPELTLYKQNGVLRSAFLSQATLSALEGGSGCWYPLCEGVGASVYNSALRDPAAVLILNAGNSSIWGNARVLSSGYQTALIAQDISGSPLGLASDLNLGKGRILLLNQPIKMDWFLDIYLDFKEIDPAFRICF